MSGEIEGQPTVERQDLEAQLAQMRAERDAARAQLSELGARGPSRHLIRKVTSVVLVFVSCLSFLTGGVGVWASRSLLDTDVWVERVGPLIDDPAVQSALSDEITTQTMQLVDPAALFREVLPERGQVLAVPLSSAVRGFVGDQVDDVVASDAFARLWVGVNEQAHATAVKVLRGDAEAVQATDGTVTINLVPIINEVLAKITSVSPQLFGRTVDIPDVTIDEIPTAAIDKINEAFGTDLPDDFGQFTIYDDGQLKEVQDAVALFDRIVWLSVIVFVASTIGALALSMNRRRTLVQLAVVDVLLLIVMRRAAMTAQDQLLELVRVDSNVPAVRATTDAILQGLFDGTRTLLWFLVALIAVAWVTGPSDRAIGFRRRTASLTTSITSAARERSTDPATTAWVVAHRDALRIGGVVVAVGLLVFVDLSWFWVFVLLALVAGYEVLLTRLETAEVADDAGVSGDDDVAAPTAPRS